LDLLTEELLLEIHQTNSSLLKNTAIRLLDRLVVSHQADLATYERTMVTAAKKGDPDQALQLALSAHVLGEKARIAVLEEILLQHADLPLIRDAVMSSLSGDELTMMQHMWQAETWKVADPAKEIFLEMLTTTVMKKSEDSEIKSLLAMVDKSAATTGWKEKTVLTGMSIQAGNMKLKNPIALNSAPLLFTDPSVSLDTKSFDRLRNLFTWPGFTPVMTVASETTLDDKGMEQFALGRQKYLVTCAGCHGSDGKGVNRMGPPLTGSEWVLGDEKRLSLIILHGMDGPLEVKGKKYDAPEILPVMPAHSTMDDAWIAAILTYIRNEWGNQAPAVTGRTVSSTRHTSQGRVYPWSASELNRHIENLPGPTPNP
jgi:mono/diheme cytochrome c family protein